MGRGMNGGLFLNFKGHTPPATLQGQLMQAAVSTWMRAQRERVQDRAEVWERARPGPSPPTQTLDTDTASW